ncbi:MAG: DUF6873 family GME fold protein [Oscillospiraceae bacterium]
MSRILIGERALPRLKRGLEAAGFHPIPVPDNPYVDARLAFHTDLSVFRAAEKTLIIARHLAENANFVNELTNDYIVIPCHRKQAKEYPQDANLCVCTVGDTILHNRQHTDPVILENTTKQFVHVKQGYANCMVCVVDDSGIITADPGIAAAAESIGIEVLPIRPGFIRLEGFDTGFIGGASFGHRGTVYFTGTLDEHPDRDRIFNFIAARGKSVVCLSHEAAFDVGGAVVL